VIVGGLRVLAQRRGDLVDKAICQRKDRRKRMYFLLRHSNRLRGYPHRKRPTYFLISLSRPFDRPSRQHLYQSPGDWRITFCGRGSQGRKRRPTDPRAMGKLCLFCHSSPAFATSRNFPTSVITQFQAHTARSADHGDTASRPGAARIAAVRSASRMRVVWVPSVCRLPAY